MAYLTNCTTFEHKKRHEKTAYPAWFLSVGNRAHPIGIIIFLISPAHQMDFDKVLTAACRNSRRMSCRPQNSV